MSPAPLLADSLLPLLTMIPFGLGIGLANGVGNLLGAGKPQEAWRLTQAAGTLTLVVVVSYATIVLLCQKLVIHQYTDDPEVEAGASQIWLFLSLDLVCDGTFMFMTGLCRGVGVQNRSAACVFICLWVIGLPTIAFGAHSVLGIWRTLPRLGPCPSCRNSDPAPAVKLHVCLVTGCRGWHWQG